MRPRLTAKDIQIGDASKTLVTKVYGKLIESFPEGNFEDSAYYRLELKEFIEILEKIAAYHIRFGDYLIANGPSGTKYGGLIKDMGCFFYTFLALGHPNGSEDWGKVKDPRDTYIRNSPEPEFQAIHEMLGVYIKRRGSGFEKTYYD